MFTSKGKAKVMNEDYSYSRSQYERNTLAPTRRAKRLGWIVCIAVIAMLVASYLNARVFHWF